jgi:hypothetical protein
VDRSAGPECHRPASEKAAPTAGKVQRGALPGYPHVRLSPAADPLGGRTPLRQLKASRAYIAGLGTSGVLIASFLLLLMVGSAIVAFQGAPGQASNDGLERLDVSASSRQAALASRAERADDGLKAARHDHGGHGGDARGAGDARRAHLGTRQADGAGNAGGDSAAGGLTGGPAGGADPGGTASAGREGGGGGGRSTGARDGASRAGRPGPGAVPTAPALGEVTDALAGTVEQTTGGLGETVGRVAPQLEAPVVQAGEALGGVVEQTGPALDGTVGQVNGTVDNVTGAVGGVTDRVRDTAGGLVGGAP